MNRTWTNRDLSFIEKYRSKLHQIQQQQIKQKKQLIDRVIRLNFTLKNNYLSFCKKLRFQTLHLKQKELTKSIKIFQKNQVKRPKQNLIRKSLKNKKEQILFLSEIYQNLEEGNDKFYFQQLNSNKIVNENLDNWNQKRLQKENQKLPKQCLYSANKRVPGQRRSGNQLLTAAFLYRQKQSLINNNMEKYNVKKFKDGANLKLQIEKFLQIIQMSNNQSNIMNRFVFVENSSKILKQQLDQKKEELQKLIKSKQQMLFRKLEQHHQIFKQKAKIIQQQKKSQQAKDQISSKLTNTLNLFPKIENKSTQAQQKFQQRIQKLNNIQTQHQYEKDIVNINQDLKNIKQADESYYKTSLKNGIDCRQSGLGWIIKKLKQNNYILDNLIFPQYFDKKSKAYIIRKQQLESALQEYMQIKRQFVNQIDKQNRLTAFSKKRVSVIFIDSQQHQKKRVAKSGKYISQSPGFSLNVPLRYCKSIKKISILDQKYATNHHLFEIKEKN